jgi:exoribonuclease R
MARHVVRAPAETAPFPAAFARIRSEFGVPDGFPAAVDAEADAVARRGPVAPPGAVRERYDARDLPLVTIDPPGSLDLDQAFHAERRGRGFRVRYAIADVAAFVTPGGALDEEAFIRGVTLYLPDGRAPLMPNSVGQGCASLLPEQERPALLWTFDLDDAGAATSTHVERATVRSRKALTYAEVQATLDAGRSAESLVLLRQIGVLRLGLEADRGGVSLDLPSQAVVPAPNGGFALRYDAPLPVEAWNAQISLLTGMEAAATMVEAGIGIVRTVPSPQQEQLDRLRRTAQALGVSWPPAAQWSDVVRGLDRTKPEDAAFLTQAAHLLRGAGYAKLDSANTKDPTQVPIHAGVAAPYAHVTAPLRRCADRHANEIVLAQCSGSEPPEWARASLDRLVTTMEAAARLDASVEHAVIDAVECAVLAPYIGSRFDAMVIDKNEHGVMVQLSRPAVVAHLDADVPLGERISIVVVAADPVARRIVLRPN